MSTKQLERQLQCEREARETAERLLNEKSQELLHSTRTLELALWASEEAIWRWDVIAGSYSFTAFRRDHAKHELNGSVKSLLAQVHPDDISALEQQMARHVAGETDALDAAFRFYSESRWKWLRIRGQATERDANNKALLIVGTSKDISEQQQQVERLNQLARYDVLTGLLNRRTIQQELVKLTRNPKPFCLLFLDLDGFKLLNDSLGHGKGDEYLQSVADTLRRELPKDALIARYGGDEFICVFPQAGWEHIVGRLITAKTSFNSGSSTKIQVTGSIGVALYPEHATEPELLLEYADAAMYQAKAIGKDCYVVYEPSMSEAQWHRITMLSELREAIENETLQFYLQPKFDSTPAVKGAELLCRWKSKSFGNVSPAVFIPLVEEHGLSEPLARLAVKMAAHYLHILTLQNNPTILAVNISAEQVLSESFLQWVCQMCDELRIERSFIEFEVTESVFMNDNMQTESALQRVRKAGFRIAMDDFGTGYSSLSYISRYQFDTIKIDQSFIRDMLTLDKARLLVEGIVSICHTLDMRIVAEGVETEEQFNFLKKLGVQRYQGFYLSRPQPFEKLMSAGMLIPLEVNPG